jgi:1,4-dihydroxy-2-naphthoyl-CoA hydrolase
MATIWKNPKDLKFINELNGNCMPGHLGIVMTEIGDDFLKGTMPVDHRTQQPMGLLHGGASAVLSETLGSIAGLLAAGPLGQFSVVGIEINANHLSSAKSGILTGTCRPVKIGKTIHVWNTDITDESGNLVCVSRLTVMVRPIH